MPKVSVIIPVYGVEKYMERCVKSLFEQTLDDIEYIFIDDCTLDNSIRILERMIEEYRSRLVEEKKQVQIVRMSVNSGQAAVRRYGVQLATGDYIIHCDSDDWIDINMYRIMYEKAISDNSDMVVCDYCITDGQKLTIYQRGCSSTKQLSFINDMLYQKVSWAVWNKLVKKTLFNENIVYPKANIGEDMMLTIILAFGAIKISYVDVPLYNYFYNEESIMRFVDKTSSLNKFYQLKQNTDALIHYLSQKKDININKIVPSLRMSQCLFLNKYVSDKEIYCIWRKELKAHWRMLFNRNILLKYKILYIVIHSKLYRLFLNLKEL